MNSNHDYLAMAASSIEAAQAIADSDLRFARERSAELMDAARIYALLAIAQELRALRDVLQEARR
ncbi:MAG: hypothetical protein ACFLMY_05015 [Candidatus Brachytrichaceae bacterium NZ_4S206]|jgi:hypothetical protein